MVALVCVLSWPGIGSRAFMLLKAVSDVIPPSLMILVLLAIPFWLIFMVLDERLDSEYRPFE